MDGQVLVIDDDEPNNVLLDAMLRAPGITNVHGVTEHTQVEDSDELNVILDGLRDRDVRLGLDDIVAEGVETAEELRVPCELGVPFGQGHYLARPGDPRSVLAGVRRLGSVEVLG
jgi:EAL domain-containing protein (putative c-di-GMP-specific phosphodiesterase class I)